jgi:Uma2 family endonuclease
MEKVRGDLPLAVPAPRTMTEEEFEAWCDEDIKAEWVDGEVIVHSPALDRHVLLTGFLLNTMGLFARHHDSGVVMGPEFQIRLPGRRRVPDVLFVRKERRDLIRPTYLDGPPDLIVEIVSPDSVERDWREKYLEYEAHGVPEYWVIDPSNKQARVYVLNEQRQYVTASEEDGALKSTALAGFWLRAEWLWQDPLPNPLEVLRQLNVI